MDPITLSLLMAGGQALLPAIKSIKQGQTLKNLPDVSRPDFQIPEAATEQLGIARSIAGNRNMPGYNEALDKIENQTNRAIGDVKAAGGNMQDIMAAMASANVGAAMAKRDLDITNDRSYLGSLQNLQGQLGQYANWQNAQQQDEMKKYNDEMARRAALDTARQQNMQNAIGSVAQGGATALGYQMNMNLMNKMYPGSTTPPVVPPAQEPPMEKMASINPVTLSLPTVTPQPQLNQPMNPMQAKSLEMPNAGVSIDPQLQNMGSVSGDAQQIASILQNTGLFSGGSTYNEQDVMNRIINMPEMSRNQNVTPNFQPTAPTVNNVASGQQQQFQTPFNMLTPDQQQKRILELMLSGVIK